jgi:hypothetical protein
LLLLMVLPFLFAILMARRMISFATSRMASSGVWYVRHGMECNPQMAKRFDRQPAAISQ